MTDKDCFFPGVESTVRQAAGWLDVADDVFESISPVLDVHHIMELVLELALAHSSSGIRCDALLVLQKGLVNHPRENLDVRPLAEQFPMLSGEELLKAIHVVGLSGGAGLRGHLTEFLTHDDSFVRAEATEALSEIG